MVVSKTSEDFALLWTLIPKLENLVPLDHIKEELLLLPVPEESLALTNGTSKTELKKDLQELLSTEMVLLSSRLLHLSLLYLHTFSDAFQSKYLQCH